MSLRTINYFVVATAFLVYAEGASLQSDPAAIPQDLAPVIVDASSETIPIPGLLDTLVPLDALEPEPLDPMQDIPIMPPMDNLGMGTVLPPAILPVDGDAYSLAAPGTEGVPAVLDTLPGTGIPEPVLVPALIPAGEADAADKLKAFVLGQSASSTSATEPAAVNGTAVKKVKKVKKMKTDQPLTKHGLKKSLERAGVSKASTEVVVKALKDAGVNQINLKTNCEKKDRHKTLTAILFLVILTPMAERFYLGYHAGPIFALILWFSFLSFFTFGTGCVSHFFGYLSVNDKEKMKMRLTAAGATMVVLFVLFVVCFVIWGFVDFSLLLTHHMKDGNGCRVA